MSPLLPLLALALVVAVGSSRAPPRAAVYGPPPPRPGPAPAPANEEEQAIAEEHGQLLTADALESSDLEFVLGARSELGRLRESLGLPPSALVEAHLSRLVAEATETELEVGTPETIESLRNLLSAFGAEFAPQVEALTWALDMIP